MAVAKEDQQWIERMAMHDSVALAEVIQTYGPVITALVRRILGYPYSERDLEECVSDVFVRAWSSVAEFDRARGDFRTWLLMLAKYTALDFRRRHPSRTDVELTASADHDAWPHVETNPVERAVLSRETLSEFRAAVASLDQADKLIFYRRYVLYESIDEIARAMDTSRHAIDNRLWRIRKTLKERLADIDERGGCSGGRV